jgi:hypothetical protein
VPACPNGAVPNPSGTANPLVWANGSNLPQDVLNEVERLLPGFVQSMVAQLVRITDLCSSNPDPPPSIGITDVLGGIGTGRKGWGPSPALVWLLWQNIQYNLFNTYCQCNAGGTPAPPATGQAHNVSGSTGCADGVLINQGTCLSGGQLYLYIQGLVSTYSPDNITVWDSQWSPAIVPGVPCPQTDPRITTVHPTPTGAFPNFSIPDGWYGPFTLSPNAQAGQTINQLNIEIVPTASPTSNTWAAYAQSHLSCVSAPPAHNPPLTTTAPSPPPLVCDATTLCQITWILNNYLTENFSTVSTVNQTTTNTSSDVTVLLQSAGQAPYTDGASYQLVGQGEQPIAPATRALRAVITSWPSPLAPRPTVPPDFFNVGWLVTGSGNQWDRRTWLRRSPQFIQPLNQPLTQFSWGLADQVTATVTELL